METKCPHGITLGKCTGCPESEIKDKWWIQGYSLSPYSNELGRDTQIGRLVHNLKYSKVYSKTDLDNFAVQLSTELKNFIRRAFPAQTRPFDYVVVPPSNLAGKPFELMPYLADQLLPGRISNLSNLLIQTRVVPPLKNIHSLHERFLTINESMDILSTDGYAPRGILILDDVFEFGSTAREVARVMEAAFPEVPRYYIALTKKRGWQ